MSLGPSWHFQFSHGFLSLVTQNAMQGELNRKIYQREKKIHFFFFRYETRFWRKRMIKEHEAHYIFFVPLWTTLSSGSPYLLSIKTPEYTVCEVLGMTLHNSCMEHVNNECFCPSWHGARGGTAQHCVQLTKRWCHRLSFSIFTCYFLSCMHSTNT